MWPMEYFAERKWQVEEDLAYAESDKFPGIFQVTADGSEIDCAEEHRQGLRDARDEYQRAMDIHAT